MNCANCGALLHPTADFCRACGLDVPRAPHTSTPRFQGLGGLRAMRLPAAPALHAPRVAMPAMPALPRLPRRVLAIGGVVAVAVVAVVLIASVAVAGAQDGGALAAARSALSGRDTKIASLEATIASNTQAQQSLQTSVQSAQQEKAVLTSQRDASQKQVTTLETKVKDAETTLQTQQALTTKQQQQLKTLSTCLNGTAVALAFGRSGRWASADLALSAVADACKASEALLKQ